MEHALVLGLMGLAMLLFALEVVRPDIVALGVALSLVLLGLVTVEDVFSGFSNPAVITVIAMFILSSGLLRTGVADWLVDLVLKLGGTTPAGLTLVVMLTVGVVSGFMNNIGAVAVLTPAIFLVAKRAEVPPTKLLIPLAFGSLLGGLTTLIGTPPNLLVSMALEERYEPFRMFDFLPTGLAILAVGTAYMVLMGRHLIPKREASTELTDAYELRDFLVEIRIPEESQLVEATLGDSPLMEGDEISVLRMRRAGDEQRPFVPAAGTALRAGDRIIVEADMKALLSLQEAGKIEILPERQVGDEALRGEDAELAEVAIAPGSALVGLSIEQADFRRRFQVRVLALRRRRRIQRTELRSEPLDVGTVLLVQGPPEAITELARRPEFLVVHRVEHEGRLPKKAPLALAIMALIIAAAASGTLHISVAGMLGVLAMAVTRCIRVDEMYRDVEWRVIFLIALMMPFGIAMDDDHTGTARWLALLLTEHAGENGPLVVMALIFLVTTIVTAVMSNAAAAILLAPIGISLAEGLGIQPHAFLMTIAIAASSTFLTPIGHQANVLVYGVGNYRFLDFPRVGLPLTVLIFATTLAVVPWVWPFAPL